MHQKEMRDLGQNCQRSVLVLGGYVYVLGAGLLGGDAPSVDVVVSLLLLLTLWSLLLQLLSLVLGPPVLEPHLHLGRKRSGLNDDDEDVMRVTV